MKDMLLKALSPPTAYRVKKDNPGLWADLVDQINGALCKAHLVEIEVWLDLRPLDLPDGWADDLQELIDKRREDLAEEDISSILLDRFDFT